MAGAVWPAPLEPGFVWLKRLFPGCRRVGVIYNAAEAKAEGYWRNYGAGLVEKAQRTNDPTQLRALIERVQQSRASIQEQKAE